MSNKSYLELENRYRRISLLSETTAFLHWDTAVMMPAGSALARAQQLAEMKAIIHGLKTSPEVGELLENAGSAVDQLNKWQRANFKEISRDWVKARAVPEDLVVALSHACSKCELVWRDARPSADFGSVKPLLQEVLNLTRQAGELKAAALKISLYDALLDDYEPGGKSADIDKVFGELQKFLPAFLREALELQSNRPAVIPPDGTFSVCAQKQLGEQLMRAVGFDFDRGRLDVSLHPFCGGTPDDIRITTRYDENEFTSSMMGVLHETGHAMYERGLPEAWRLQPVGNALGMSLHESQSLLIEMQVCRSRPFIKWAAGLMRNTFQGNGSAWASENLYRLYTHVEPGFIRVDADEVTYPAHVILRYRLERALLDKSMSLSDLPTAWNDGMMELLGIAPPSDREGCLQDVHWFDGAWGYFPTYTLGAMTAAQLYEAACRDIPKIPDCVAKGNFKPLVAWLGDKVHSKGRLMSSDKLLTHATGQKLTASKFINHLKSRYLQ